MRDALQCYFNYYNQKLKMPRFAPNPNAASGNIPLLPKGTARLKIGEPKAFFNSRTDDKTKETKETFGVRYKLTIVDCPEDPSLVGKSIWQSNYYHNEGSESASKRFMIAGYGFANTAQGEEEFNEKIAQTTDASFDTESGTVGDYHMGVTGRIVEVDVDVKANAQAPGGIQNQFNNWRTA
jgi:hypothetical protein